VHGTPVAAGGASGDRAGPVDFSPGILDARKMIDGLRVWAWVLIIIVASCLLVNCQGHLPVDLG